MPKFPKQNHRRHDSESHGLPAHKQGPQTHPNQALNPTRLTYRPFNARNAVQQQILETIRHNAITFIIGPAGTGKTMMASAYAMEALGNGDVETVIAARPAVEAGDSIGFLPGSLMEKMSPFLRPVFDCLGYFVGKPVLQQLLSQETVEVTSLTYVRGRTFNDAVVIYDEMQNATPEQLKMCLTRAGDNCKIIVTADPGQCDLAATVASAAEDFDRFRGLPGIAFIDLETRDVVRSAVVKTVLKAYGE